MSTDLWPEGYGRLILDRTSSTMAEAAARALTLDKPTWIMARDQSAGRGRRGRSWTMAEGNFAATLACRPACTPAEAARRSFMAANALYETLAIYIDRDFLALKWPNDVLINHGKVAGILLETSSSGPYVDWLAVGVGVNLAEAPRDDKSSAFPPVSLVGEGGEAADPVEFLTLLAQHFATQERMLARIGFGRIRDEWLEHAARLGEVITARTQREEITGRFETVDDDGCLVLKTASGTRIIPAADVFF